MLKDNRLERLEYMKMMVKLIGKSVTLSQYKFGWRYKKIANLISCGIIVLPDEPPSIDVSKLRASCGYLKRFVEEYDLEVELLNAIQEFVCNINHPYGDNLHFILQMSVDLKHLTQHL